jgi:hypothetical protein
VSLPVRAHGNGNGKFFPLRRSLSPFLQRKLVPDDVSRAPTDTHPPAFGAADLVHLSNILSLSALAEQ